LLKQLQASQGKNIVLELVNGRIISGTILAVDQQFVRVESDDGVGTIPVNAVQIIWETLTRSLTVENMENIAEQLRDSAKANLVCTGTPGQGVFECPQIYTCRPPFACMNVVSCVQKVNVPPSPCPAAFTCRPPFNVPPIGCGIEHLCPVNITGMFPPPGFPPPACGFPFSPTAPMPCSSPVMPSPPPAGCPPFICPRAVTLPPFPPPFGPQPPQPGCPFFFAGPGMPASAQPVADEQIGHFCRPFPFGHPCRPFQFGEHCSPFTFGCRPFEFGEHCRPFGCGPFQFGEPCRPFTFGCGPFQFGQPCGPFTFGCGPFQFEQPCGPFPFLPPCGPFQFGGSQCGTFGGFSCPGAQFIGAVVPPVGPISKKGEAPLPPMDFLIKQEDQSKDNKEAKE